MPEMKKIDIAPDENGEITPRQTILQIMGQADDIEDIVVMAKFKDTDTAAIAHSSISPIHVAGWLQYASHEVLGGMMQSDAKRKESD